MTKCLNCSRDLVAGEQIDSLLDSTSPTGLWRFIKNGPIGRTTRIGFGGRSGFFYGKPLRCPSCGNKYVLCNSCQHLTQVGSPPATYSEFLCEGCKKTLIVDGMMS